jgi:peptide/nickel transport system permease protein
VVALVFVLFLVLMAIFPSFFAPHSPTHIEILRRGESPSLTHPFGFDQIGRDVFSRVIFGARVALVVGMLATGIAVLIGTTVGALAGYYGGKVDSVLSRFVDALMAFPLFVLLVTLASVVGPGLVTVVFVIGATVWAQYARVVRADVMSLRSRDFILAARAAGATDTRIIGRHIVPNVLTPVIVLASLSIGGIIILESALSFFGLGVQPPTPSWGNILSDGRALMRIHPHIAIAPGIMITITVLAFNLLGDGLRDAFDPRQRE